MTSTPTGQLTEAGVSIWLDDLSRSRLSSGSLQTLIAEKNVVGVTTNPSIFHAAITSSSDYKSAIADLAAQGASAEQAVFDITTADVTEACTLLSPIAVASNGVDGRASIEVDPRLAWDTESTIAEARTLHATVNKSNVLIKIPATNEGLPAITTVLGDGISVNVTLIFSLSRYAAVLDAFQSGLELAATNGHDLSTIHSVASFFISRVDAEIDGRLDALGTPDASDLKGAAGVANAVLAHQIFANNLSTPRWKALAALNAVPQRLLWASTGSKNANYSDTKYVSELVTAGVVNTMPEATLLAAFDHGVFTTDTITSNYASAADTLAALDKAGVSYEDVTALLEAEGLKKFVASWKDLLADVDSALRRARNTHTAAAVFHGVGVNAGRVLGQVLQMPATVAEPAATSPKDAGASLEANKAAIKSAAKTVQTQLRNRAETASAESKDILHATAQMAGDPMLIKAAGKLLSPDAPGGPRSPARAIWEAGQTVADTLTALGGYMADRATDVLDVRSRIVAELQGLPGPGIPVSPAPYILAATDLAPADTATLDPTKVLALITAEGGPQSHTAILARMLGLPAIVAAPGVDGIVDGTQVYVDGAAGSVTTNPDESMRTAAATWATQAAQMPAFTGPNTLADSLHIPLLANVGTGEDARKAAAAGAEGVGLLRTEFCFLDREKEPTIQEQVAAYGAVLAAFPGKKVVIRTLDAGADKPLPFLTQADEPNPALGVRGYRTVATSAGVLERQLTAIATATAAHEAEVWVMAPMISTAEEAAQFTTLAKSAGLQTAGVMVEVPSAALTASAILSSADFASLGTNDLTQYAMAADRQLGPLATLNDPWQPAVLKLIKLTVEGACQAQVSTGAPKPVGVCGEAAADPALAVVLVGLGVSTLSMSARSLAPVAAVLATLTMAEAQRLAAVALQAVSATSARESVREQLPILAQLGL
ncbi:transaldolase [Arthrobacter antibioticus]